MTVPDARRVKALARFDLRRRRLSFAGGTISMVLPASMQSVLGSAPRSTQQPYWAEIWPASVGIARLLMRGPPLSDLDVLDVGCGLGLAGIAAGRRGARVVFADREADALAFARFNAEHNDVRTFSTMNLDWNVGTPDQTFDLMLLADVTYHASSHVGLLKLLDRSLGASGRALAVDPFRVGGAAFAARCAQRFDCRTAESDCFYEGQRLPLRVLEISRNRTMALPSP